MEFIFRGLSNVGIGRARADLFMENRTAQPTIQLLANLFDSIVPGYNTISRLLLDLFGFDITMLVSVSFVGFGVVKSVTFLHQQIMSLIMRFATCSVTIPSDVDSYGWVMEWLEHRGVACRAVNLTALPAVGKKTIMDVFILPDTNQDLPSLARKTKPVQKYEPELGISHYFWHNGNLFLWQRMREKRQQYESP
jgi:hypothetical protein